MLYSLLNIELAACKLRFALNLLVLEAFLSLIVFSNFLVSITASEKGLPVNGFFNLVLNILVPSFKFF